MTESPPEPSRSGPTVDIAWLAAFRILFGAVMAISALRYLAYGWIAPLWIAPRVHFRYWGFEWVPVPSGTGMYLLFGALAVLALCVSIGLFFRLSSALFAVGFAWLQLIDVTTYLNHYYLATLLAALLAISPAGRAWSVDTWRSGRGLDRVPASWQNLFRFQVGVVYVGAGLAKATSDWLVHGQPLRIWLASRVDLPVLGWLLEQDGVPLLMSWGGFLFDTTIPLWLLIRRTRPWAFLVVVLFHATTRTLFPIGMFSAIMVLSALTFFPDDWPRALARRLGLGRPALGAQTSPPWPALGRAAAAVYVVLQVALPLRHLAYGSDVIWHEQGMRFSWRVMVREKNGSLTFSVRDPETGRVSLVPARSLLTPIQEREVCGQPDLILQLAHHVAATQADRVGHPVEVRAEALVSLNGRRARPLVDPGVDLSRVSDGLGRAPWIMPAPPEAPPQVRAVAR